ncbi:MAG: acetate--CoA ligase family protein [Synergistaceae bacterium]|jgi:succinyl-CoA synthetase beta subunit|nr:acetate--CoA ligase family protein [Synergistaceae bacterium]
MTNTLQAKCEPGSEGEMKLNEIQGKGLLDKAGIPLPKGKLASSPGEVRLLVAEAEGECVLKAQIPVGGRGKAGLVRGVSSPEEAERLSKEIFGRVHRGCLVEKILVEEKLDIESELYLSFGLNADKGAVDMLTSRFGGVNVESEAEKDAAAVSRTTFSPLKAPEEYEVRNVWRKLGFQRGLLLQLADVSCKLGRLFFSHDLVLAEINPLVILKNGSVAAADAKLEVDDNALFRHPELGSAKDALTNPMERRAFEIGVTCVLTEGTVGVIASGAGLAMNTMDILASKGAAAANFLETGGGIDAVLMRDSVKLVMNDSRVKGLIINLYGGVNPMVAAAEGIAAGWHECAGKMPVVVKILGNQQEEAWKIVEDAGLPVVKNVHTETAVDLLLRKMASAEVTSEGIFK